MFARLMPGFAHSRPLLKWLVGFLIWTLVGLSFASQFYVANLNVGRPVSWVQAIGWSLGDWYVWGLLSIPVLALTRRFHLEGKFWPSNLAVHLGASAVTALGYLVIRATVGRWQSSLSGPSPSFIEVFRSLLAKTFFFNVLIYWVIVCAGHALDYYGRFRQRERRTLELETSLSQAKLKSLQMQLNPHFLFNTLHAISALMHRNVDDADRMIAQLSDLLRRALDSGEEHEIPLRQELDFLERYLTIEQTRFGKRLTVQFDIAPETLEALVPNLLLQPLVENAIQHGIEPRAKKGNVAISAKRAGDELVLEVRDDGVGLPATWKENVGVSNTRLRLAQLHPRRHHFALQNRPTGGVAATASLPFRRASDVSHENPHHHR